MPNADYSGQLAERRFWAKVDVGGVCWEWTGFIGRKGYGQTSMVTADGRRINTGAHRRAYKALVGEIPDEMTLDHLCRNKRCVNPDHLEVVTRMENYWRATFETEVCKNGHEYTPENTLPTESAPGKKTKRCRQCLLVRDHQRRGFECTYDAFCASPSHRARRGLAETCGRGHSLADAYIRPDTGGRQCRECRKSKK